MPRDPSRRSGGTGPWLRGDAIGILSQGQQSGKRWSRILRRNDHPAGGKFLFVAAAVRGEDLRRKRYREKLVLERRTGEVGQRGRPNRTEVERKVLPTPFLGERPLLLNCGDATTRPDPNPCAPVELHGRNVRRLDNDNDHLGTEKNPFLDKDRRRRQNATIGLHVRNVAQKLVRHGQAGRRTVVVRSDEEDAGVIVAREVVRKRAYRLPRLCRDITREGRLPLGGVGLKVPETGQQFCVGQ